MREARCPDRSLHELRLTPRIPVVSAPRKTSIEVRSTGGPAMAHPSRCRHNNRGLEIPRDRRSEEAGRKNRFQPQGFGPARAFRIRSAKTMWFQGALMPHLRSQAYDSTLTARQALSNFRLAPQGSFTY